MNRTAYASRESDNWATPKYIYEQAKQKDYFDPCPLNATFDGLSIPWEKRTYCNPPYSQLRKWVVKAIEENKKGNEIILLIPARTDTKAFKLLYEHGAKIKFITGRLKFNEAGNAPFPSMIVELTGNKKTTCELISKNNISL